MKKSEKALLAFVLIWLAFMLSAMVGAVALTAGTAAGISTAAGIVMVAAVPAYVAIKEARD